MSIKKVYPKIIPRKKIGNIFLGNFRSHFGGRGIEFQDYREYAYGDSARHIDWQVSSREGTTLLRRYHEDREVDFFCLCDVRESLDYNLGEKRKLFQDTLQFLIEMSDALGENIGGYIDALGEYRFIRPKKAVKNRMFFDLERYKGKGVAETLDLSLLLQPSVKKSIVFCISDSYNIDEPSMSAAAKKHDIVYIHLSSFFEDTLEGDGIHHFSLGNAEYFIDIGDAKKRNEYTKLREKQKQDFSHKMKKLGVSVLFLHEKTDIMSAFHALMQERKYM